jgi:hypothetical protein
MVPAGELAVGGSAGGANIVRYSPPSDDFWLFAATFATSPTFGSLGYSQASCSSDCLFYTTSIDGDSLSVTPVSATPLPAALPLLAGGLGALGLLGWRRKRTARSVAV